jgi:ABC-2 type transport system permease protein
LKKTFALVKREYLFRVRTKGFLIGTLLMPVFMLVITFLPVLFANANAEKTVRIAVIDFSQKVVAPLTLRLEQTKQGENGESLYKVRSIKISETELTKTQDQLNKEITDGKLDLFVVIPKDVQQTNSIEYYSKNITNFELNEKIHGALSITLNNIRLQQSGLDAELIRTLMKRVDLNTFKVGEKGATRQSGGLAFGITYGLVLMLYMALLLYGTFVMTSVIEDKNSRVIEVILSSVKPHEFMAGKIIGTGGAGLTQFFVWIIFAIFSSTFGIYIARQFAPQVSDLPLPEISLWIYVAFMMYFLLGFFLYATLYAMLGSMVNSIQESQNLQWPVMSFLIVGMLMMLGIIKNPDSTLAVVLSLIPFFTPLLMFLRVAVGAAPLWQVILSIIIMSITIWGFVIIAGRIFRVGILMYGKRPTLPEVLRWIKYSG